ncbi:AAA family ATPase [Streptomyces netropsis]|uniref:DNA-binding CsgD family transcriptional regulator n=1 Tax=Streptomyces netropsis TaxID=55404 RepID=A0A7W7L8E7_STRNE|nr:LuxR family transcriptional regulator [Streptomyces netropsis]MBB4885477.1 DNA-binding CsgD family transcriptional regulator [Streptomyces netropsis]GGR38457.1 transcriptional regulator [Streptomyces netropsis]
MVLGRERERNELAALLDDAREGLSRALVVRGPAGIGKSTLLDDLVDAAQPDVRVLRAVGVESEVELPFAGLHQVLRPLLPGLDRLPAPQAGALRAVFGLETTSADRFLVALAVLTLLSDACEEAPALVLVDDAHWLDPASAEALVFVARRLEAEGLAMVFAIRTGAGRFDAPGVPDLHLGPLPGEVAEQLLERSAPEAVRSVRLRLLSEAGGNPLALRELPAALDPDQLSGSAALPECLPLNDRLQQIYHSRRAELPARYSDVLLLAAVENDGDLAAILRAGGDPDAAIAGLSAAAAAGLIDLGEQRVLFTHPLIRSATYQAASLTERRAAHLALAHAMDEEDERRVWHLAAATIGTDDTVAGLMATLADRSRRAGGATTASRALRRAAALASSPRVRARWLIDAAECAWTAAEPSQATALLDEAESLTSTPELRARSAQVRGAITHASSDPAIACRTLMDGARLVLESDALLAGEMLVMAARSAWVANTPRQLGEIAALLDRSDRATSGVSDHFMAQLRWLRSLAPEQTPIAVPWSHTPQASAARVPAWLSSTDPKPWVWPPVFLPHMMGDTATTLDAYQRAVDTLRRNGAVGALPMSVAPLVALQLITGQWTVAMANGAEALFLADETGQLGAASHLRAMLAWIAAARGDSERCRELAAESLAISVPRRIASSIAVSHWALGLNALAERKAPTAARLLREVVTPGAPAEHFMMGWLVLPDLVEASLRAGQVEEARRALKEFECQAIPARLPELRATWLRCRALLAPDDEADALFGAALDAPAASAFDTGRTHLLYGEWLRRVRRIKDAREHLHQAVSSFSLVGAEPWADTARHELRAAGELLEEPGTDTGEAWSALTPRERQIVRLVAQGMSNSDIAAQLFLSPRTVGYHLYKVFPKLGLTSRSQLHGRSVPPGGRAVGGAL